MGRPDGLRARRVLLSAASSIAPAVRGCGTANPNPGSIRHRLVQVRRLRSRSLPRDRRSVRWGGRHSRKSLTKVEPGGVVEVRADAALQACQWCHSLRMGPPALIRRLPRLLAIVRGPAPRTPCSETTNYSTSWPIPWPPAAVTQGPSRPAHDGQGMGSSANGPGRRRRSRLQFPEGADRHGAQIWPERESVLACVQDHAGDEVAAESVLEMP
jgi:hypothetical protein